MTEQLSSSKKHIISILDKNELLIKSDLVHLSDLTDEEIAFLDRKWKDADIKRRRKVITDIVQLGQENFRLDFSDIFILCLKDSDHIIRERAIAGLEQEENYLHIPLLVEILRGDKSAEVRKAAANALGKFALLGELGKLSDNDVKAVYYILLKVIENDSEPIELRGRALEAIAPLNMPKVKQLIEQAYKSDNISLKASAIRAMGINSQPFWQDALLNELNNSEFEIRREAVYACGELGMDSALPYILRILETGDVPIQEAAVWALGEIGGDEARKALNVLKKNPNKRLRNASKMALKELDTCEDLLSLDF